MIKQIPKSDITVRSFKVYKKWTLDQTDMLPTFGKHITGSIFDPETDEMSNGQYKRLTYQSTKTQFYNNPSTASILFETGLRNSYASTDERVISEEIAIISLPQLYYGEGIKIGSVSLTDGIYMYTDDSHSNLINGSNICGNIFYDKGMIILTSGIVSGSTLSNYSLSYRSTKTINETEVFIEVLPTEFNVSTNPSAYYEDGKDSYTMIVNNSLDRFKSPTKTYQKRSKNPLITQTTIPKYGYLYSYQVTYNSICAANAHIPSVAEYNTLLNYLGGVSVSAGKLKEVGTSHWQSPNTGATNSVGFALLPAGYRDSLGNYESLTQYAYLLTSDLQHIFGYDYNVKTIMNYWYSAETDIGQVPALPNSYGLPIRLIIDTPNSISIDNPNRGIYIGNDLRQYTCTKIGTQWWLDYNLAETKYQDFSDIPEVSDTTEWSVLTYGARCSYNNDEYTALEDNIYWELGYDTEDSTTIPNRGTYLKTFYTSGIKHIRNSQYPYTSSIDPNVFGSFDDYIVSGSSNMTGSYLAPFITTIGLYDNDLNMVAVAKLPQPIKSLPDYPVNFIIRMDL